MEKKIIATVSKTYKIYKYGKYTERNVGFTVGASMIEYLYKRVLEADKSLHDDYPEVEGYFLKKVDEKIDFIEKDTEEAA